MHIAFIALMLLFSFSCNAGKSVDILSGIYITDIYNINEKDQTFQVSFWAWWLSPSHDYNPLEGIEISNSRKVEVSRVFSEKIGSLKRTEAFYDAVIKQAWNLKHFPFDRQKLEIIMEDVRGDTEIFKLRADIQNTKLATNLISEEWEISKLTVVPGIKTYHTNFGDPQASSSSSYSNLKFEVELKRNGWRTYINLFFGLLLAAFFNSIMFLLPVGDIGTRFSLNLASVFTVIGTKYIIDTSFPATSYISLADKLILCNFLLMIFAIISSIISYYLSKMGKEVLSKYYNKIYGIILTSAYYIFFICFTLTSYFS